MTKDEATWIRYLAAVAFGVATMAVFCLQAWLIMLGFGVLHSVFSFIPAIGYGIAAIVTLGINTMTSVFYLASTPRRD